MASNPDILFANYRIGDDLWRDRPVEDRIKHLEEQLKKVLLQREHFRRNSEPSVDANEKVLRSASWLWAKQSNQSTAFPAVHHPFYLWRGDMCVLICHQNIINAVQGRAREAWEEECQRALEKEQGRKNREEKCVDS